MRHSERRLVLARSRCSIWAEHGLKPHQAKSFKVCNDPDFARKVEDIAGLYLDPPRTSNRRVAASEQMLRDSFDKGILEIGGGELYNFVSAPIVGGTRYHSTGPHSHIILYSQRAKSPISLEPGTYRLRVQGSVRHGRIHCPVLYLDLGKGFSEDRAGKFACRTGMGSLLSAVLTVAGPVKRLRLDPSLNDVDLVIARMTLERLAYSAHEARDGCFRSPVSVGKVATIGRQSDGAYGIPKAELFRFKLRPAFNLREELVNGVRHYKASGPDPQADLVSATTEGPIWLPAGHLRFVFEPHVTSGRIVEPTLYIDHGEGFSESRALKLQETKPSLWSIDFDVAEAVVQFRLGPSVRMCSFFVLRLDAIKLSVTEQLQEPIEGRWLYSASRMFLALIPKFWRESMDRTGTATRLFAEFFPRSFLAKIDYARDMTAGITVADEHLRTYLHAQSIALGMRDIAYGAIAADAINRKDTTFRPIAFYLPQMHPVPENDRWWGKGFTEWTNVSKAMPQFVDHYQPRLPGELGFYDLRCPETMYRQIELAKLYGIYAFCFYYYWFDGRRLLERPVDMFLADKKMDFKFCLCWANENWTRRWDGAEQEILIPQNHSKEDKINVFYNINSYFQDDRYVRIYGKPVIVIYRPDNIPDTQNLVQTWRREGEKIGLPGLYIIASNAFGFDSPKDFGFDAICEFPPHGLQVPEINSRLTRLNPNYDGRVYDYADVVSVEIEKLTARGPTALPRFPSVMPSWDNEPRTPGKGHVFHGATPSLFHKWFNRAAEYATQNFPPEERLVFINAWNEWAEGAYLEPDRRYGYANLAAVGNVVRRFNSDAASLCVRAFDHNRTKTKTSETALCLHIFYADLVTEVAEAIRKIKHQRPVDIIVSIPESWSPSDLDRLIEEIDPLKVLVCANIGRDVWPFIQSLRICLDMGYVFGCKLHSKKSLHVADGTEWRQRLFSGLLSKKVLVGLESIFFADETCGLAAPENSFRTLHDAATVFHNERNMRVLMSRLGSRDPIFEEFIAGTMFWFRFSTLEKLAKLDIDVTWFDEEYGQIDGTMAHAFERIFVSVTRSNGYKVAKYKQTG